MKFAVAIALLGYTRALENEEGDGKTEVAQWKDTQTKFTGPWDRECKYDNNCPNTNEVCAGHMWEYNNQQESGRGCWDNSVCSGNASFYMFDGRKIQFWCDYKDKSKFGGKYSSALAYPIWQAKEQHWLEWEETCQNHDQCRDRNGRKDQHCTDFIWEAVEGGEAYSKGTSCYTWDRNMCDDKEGKQQSFAIINDNYRRTKFSYYTQMWCRGYDGAFWREGSMPAAVSRPAALSRDGARDAAAKAAGAARGSTCSSREECEAEAMKMAMDAKNGKGAHAATAGDWDNKRGGDRKDDGIDMTMGDNSLRMNDKDGIEFNGEGFSMTMNEQDGQTRLEIVMGATKIAATAATAIVASTLY